MARVRGALIARVRGARYGGVEGIDSAHPRSAFEGHVLRASRVLRVRTILGERGSETDAACLCMFASLSLN